VRPRVTHAALEQYRTGAAAQSLSRRPAKPRFTSTGSRRGADTFPSPRLGAPRPVGAPRNSPSHGVRMCHYVTAILPPKVSLASLAPIAAQYRRQLTPLAGPGLGAYLAPGEQYVLTTAGPCDCDTALGHQVRASRQAERPHDDAARRLAAKGWSSARIARSLAQREKARARHTATSTAQADTDLARWEGFLVALLESGVAYVGLVVHDYEGPVDAGVALTGRQIVALGRETAPLRTVLASMREDCRYDFRVHRDRTVAASASSLAP
jgi:hypothetical protein